MKKAKTAKKQTAKKKTRKQKSADNKAAHAHARTRTRAQAGTLDPTKSPEPAESPRIIPYPRAGRKVKEFEDALDGQLADDKSGAFTPSSSATPGSADTTLDVSVISGVVSIPFDLWAISQDVSELALDPKESVMIAKPVKELLDHYLPQIPTIVWAWISVAVTSYSVMKTRMVLIQVLKKERAAAVPTDGSGPTPPPSPQGPARQGRRQPPVVTFPSADEIKVEKVE